MFKISTSPLVWTITPLVDHESFQQRVLRALPFQGRCQDGVYSLDGKTWHWQNSTLCFSVMTDQVMKKKEDPKKRFDRLRSKEPACPLNQVVVLREKIENHFREISIDYVSLLDYLDDYEALIHDLDDESSYLLLHEVDRNTKRAVLDYVALNHKIQNSFIIDCALELNQEVKFFEGMKELLSPEEIEKGEQSIHLCTTLLNSHPFNESEFYKHLGELHRLIINIPFRKMIKSELDEIKEPLKQDFSQLNQKIKSITGDDQLCILQKALQTVRIIRVVRELQRQKNSEHQTKPEKVRISFFPLLYTLAKLKTIFDILKTLPSMKVENIDVWFIEVKEKIVQGDFDQAAIDIQLMEGEFIEPNKTALNQIFERFKKVVITMQEFHVDSLLRDLNRSLKAGKTIQEILDKWSLSNPEKKLLMSSLSKNHESDAVDTIVDEIRIKLKNLHRKYSSAFRQINYLIIRKDSINAYYKLLKINETL